MATVATLKRKIQKMWTGEVFKLVKDSLGTGLPRVNFHECLGYLLSNKSVQYNTTDSREYLSLPKEEINHDDSNNNKDIISHDNTMSDDVTCVLDEDFNFS